MSEIPDVPWRKPEPRVEEVGPWRGLDLEEWLDIIARPILHPGETLPLVKPLEQPEQ